METLAIKPLSAPVDAEVRVPGSKSITNRALLIAALANGTSVLHGALFSEDTAVMADSLRRLGIPVAEDPAAERFVVHGRGGPEYIRTREAELFVGLAGTAARFLTALVALGHGRYLLDGTPRMRERPMRPLLGALNALGAQARSLPGTGSFPIEVTADGLEGGRVRMPGSQSSQFFSALLLVGPLTRRGLEIVVEGDLVSQPFIDLTAAVMADFGVQISHQDYRHMCVPGGQAYRAREYAIEPDASTAGYFFAAAALTGGRVRVPGLGTRSVQGDLGLLTLLERMGCTVRRAPDGIEVSREPSGRLQGVDADLNAISDMAQTVAALAPFAEGPTVLRHLAHTRLQETDRLAAVATELRRLGQEVEEFPDGLRITPRPVRSADIRTYGDHRMAMAFALVGLRAPGIRIEDPGCVRKTFPDYWERLASLRR
ncbi:MAG: 3-phosphoshikimate 1-carboxyvinyltransferase [Armatimonadetes bacterium]|nr:3-phosphoshikimate 1-carboxyvinyltransferase [Armatimonadota bacterium]